jgi:colanic acid biosynthesis glycosyl transferase WcaI
MRIMIMAQCYAPENVSAAVLITELAVDLVKHGHQVSVITGAPNYPDGRVYEGYRNQLYQVEMLDGVRIIRTWSYISPSKKFWPRLFHYGTYSVSSFYGGLMAGCPDVLVSFSPPLPLGLSAWLLSRIWRRPWLLQIEDLYPDAAVAAGVLKNKIVINFFLKMEQFLYVHSQRISVISESFRRVLLAKGVPCPNIEVIPVWANPDQVRPMPKDNSFRHKHGLDGKFVVIYAGNIGLTSCLEDVLAAAEILRNRNDIQIVLVGEGVKKESLEAESRAKNLNNVLFLPYQPREVFAEMLAAADMGLVTLNPGACLSSLPSKTFNVMASGRPILAVTPPEGEVARLIRVAGCGWNVPPTSPRKLAGVIVELKGQSSLLDQMGKNGRSYLERYYARSRCVDIYEMMLTTLYNKTRTKIAHVEGVS